MLQELSLALSRFVNSHGTTLFEMRMHFFNATLIVEQAPVKSGFGHQFSFHRQFFQLLSLFSSSIVGFKMITIFALTTYFCL